MGDLFSKIEELLRACLERSIYRLHLKDVHKRLSVMNKFRNERTRELVQKILCVVLYNHQILMTYKHTWEELYFNCGNHRPGTIRQGTWRHSANN